MVNERTRSVVQTWEFLRDLSRNESLPESIRIQAKSLLRHYPEPAAIWLTGRAEEARRAELSLLAAKHGPLHPALGLWLVTDPLFCDQTPD